MKKSLHLVVLALLSCLSLHCGGGGGSGGGAGSLGASSETRGLYWHTGAATGTVDVYEVADGTLRKTHRPLGGPRSVAILGDRNAIVTDGARIGIFPPFGEGAILPYPAPDLGFLKTVCATGVADEFIAGDQMQDQIVRFRALPGGNLERVWAAPTGPAPRGLLVDGIGNVWVACKNQNQGVEEGRDGFVVLHRGSDGQELMRFTVPFGCRGLGIDPGGMAWVACFGDQLGRDDPRTGNGDTVVGLTPFGHRIDVVVGKGPFSVACDAQLQKYVTCVTENALYKIDENGAVVASGFPVRFDDHPDLREGGGTSVAIDGDRRLWVAFKRRPALAIVDAETGAILQVIRTPGDDAPEPLGDPTAYHLAMVLFPGADFDGDGSPNLDELVAGTSPFARRLGRGK